MHVYIHSSNELCTNMYTYISVYIGIYVHTYIAAMQAYKTVDTYRVDG